MPMFPSLFSPIVADFSNELVTVVVPAGSVTFAIPLFFTIVDDDIDEDEQSFAVVAEIGPDVPDNVSCFHLGIGHTEFFGRRGTTEIRIGDNDCKLFYFCLTNFLINVKRKTKCENVRNDCHIKLCLCRTTQHIIEHIIV